MAQRRVVLAVGVVVVCVSGVVLMWYSDYVQRPRSITDAFLVGNQRALFAAAAESSAAGDLTDDIRTADGSSLLHWAVVDGDDRLVVLLLAGGVDPSIRDRRGHTAQYYAARLGRHDLVELTVAARQRQSSSWSSLAGGPSELVVDTGP